MSKLSILLFFFLTFQVQAASNSSLNISEELSNSASYTSLFSQAADAEYVHLYYGVNKPKEKFSNELSQSIEDCQLFLWFDHSVARYHLMMKIPQGKNKEKFLNQTRQYVPDAFLWSWAGYSETQIKDVLADFKSITLKGLDQKLPSLSWSDNKVTSNDAISTTIVGELITAAQALNNGSLSNYTENATSRAQDYANQQLENSVTAWLTPYATVDFTTNLLLDPKAPSASLNALVPLYDFDSQLLFTQFGYQLNDDDTFLGRNFFNFGLGARYSTDEYIVGLNGFFDHDMTRSHQRASVGFEGFADYFKLTSNYYFPLSAWKNSPDFEMHQERVAKGFEVNVEGYLPSYPHLGASFTYEQYFGDEVDILGTKDKQSDPYAGALSVEYTPIPMISINSGITKAKGQDFRVNAGIDLTYRLGVPWDKQVSPAYVDITRQLDGNRYDLVSRNNNIVLEYREKTTFTVSLKSQSILTLNAGDDYQPLILGVVINDEKATAIPVTQSQSQQSDLRKVPAPTDYQISWTLPPALLAPSTLNNLQAFEILPPPIPGNYEYQAIVTQKSSGKSQTVTGVLTVELDNALTEVHWTPTSLINISKSSASFEITKVVNSPKLRSALKRYLDQAGATLTPRLMQHTNILNIDWAAPNITLSTKEGQTLSSLLTLEGDPVIALVYLLGFGEIVVPIILTASNLESSPLNIGDAGFSPLNIGSDVTATFGEANFTQEATGGNGGAVTYRSGNENVATVEANGEVTLVGVGSAVITATEAASANFAGQTATYTVTVTQATSGDAGFSPLNIGSDVTATFG
ncbi:MULTISPECIES: inverse autotransporter beta domain-containing protein, partial [unclassified Vibrio]